MQTNWPVRGLWWEFPCGERISAHRHPQASAIASLAWFGQVSFCMSETPPEQREAGPPPWVAAFADGLTGLAAGLRVLVAEASTAHSKGTWIGDVAKESGVLVLVFGILEPMFEVFIRHTSSGPEGVRLSTCAALLSLPVLWWPIILVIAGLLLALSYKQARRRSP